MNIKDLVKPIQEDKVKVQLKLQQTGRKLGKHKRKKNLKRE